MSETLVRNNARLFYMLPLYKQVP